MVVAQPPPQLRPMPVFELLGFSAAGRPITLLRLGPSGAARRILVVGCIHGTEDAGVAVVRRLSRAAAPPGAELLLVDDLNPDGRAAGTRQNGRGVDLNRNFPSGWRPHGVRWDPEYPGPRPLSEPETRLAVRLVARERPTVTIWFHQPQDVVRAWGPSVPTARRFARLARLPYRSIPWPAGTAPNWQNHRRPWAASFVVELHTGRLRPAEVARQARAVLALAAGRRPTRPPSGSPRGAAHRGWSR